MTGLVTDTAAARARGERVPRGRAFLTATIVAVGAGVVTYRLLRA
jgi:hypothetical protein